MAFCQYLLTSCDSSTESDTPKEVEVRQIVELPDTVKQHLIKQDSLYSGLIAKIDTLTSELNTSQQNVAQLQIEIDQFERPEASRNYIIVIAILLSIISLALHLLWKKVLNGFKHDFKDNAAKIEELKGRVLKLKTAQPLSTDRKYAPMLDDRITDLETKIKLLEIAANQRDVAHRQHTETSYNQTPMASTTSPSQNSGYTKEGYAEINSGRFFVKILNSNQEGCVYHIKFTSDNKGEFDLISLAKIKSCNGWEEIVEATGNCTMADATRYDVIRKGTCCKTTNGYWKVQDNLIIKISK